MLPGGDRADRPRSTAQRNNSVLIIGPGRRGRPSSDDRLELRRLRERGAPTPPPRRAIKERYPAAAAGAGRPGAGDVRSLPSPRRGYAPSVGFGVLDPNDAILDAGTLAASDRDRGGRRARHGRGDRALRRRAAAGADQRAAARRASRLPVLGAYRHGRGAARHRRGAVGAPSGNGRRTSAAARCRSSRRTPGADLGSSRIRGPEYQAPPAFWNPAPQAPRDRAPQAPPWDQTPQASLDRTPQAPWNPAPPPDAPQYPESWVDPR